MIRRVTMSLAALAAISMGAVSCRKQSPADSAAMAATPVVRLERGACFGTCPQYAVEIFANGSVQFDGRKYVDSMGAHQRAITSKAVNALQKEIAQGAFDTADSVYAMGSPRCGQYVTDGPQMVISALIGKSLRTVRLDTGCTGAPGFLKVLANQIDSVAGTTAWINFKGERAR